MSAESDKLLAGSVEALARHVATLYSRCDALSAMVLVLAQQSGADLAAVRKELRVIEATALQKRLEALEQIDPLGASILDTRDNLEDVDLDLLKHLRKRP